MYDVYGGGLPARLWQRVMSQVPQKRKRFLSPLRVAGRRYQEPVIAEPAPSLR